jgi:hypothetical protein
MEYTALMKDPQLKPLWTQGFGNECGRLFKGIRDIAGTDTCFFIKLTDIPKDRKIMYGKILCDNKPHKKEKECGRRQTRLFRRRRHFDGRHNDIQNPNQQHPLTEDAAMMMMDINNYYIGTALPRFEYMKMLLSHFPEEIIQKYNLNALAVDGWVYI